MKILLITDNHTPHGGGAEKQFFILKELLKNHADTTVFSLGFGTQASKGSDFIVFKETHSKALRQLWRMFFNPVKYWQLRRTIKKINPTVIHLHNIKKYTPALLYAVQGYPTLQTVHDFSPLCPTQWNVHTDLQPCARGISLKCLLQHRRNYTFISYMALLYSFIRLRTLLKKSVMHFIAPSPLLENYLKKNQFKNTSCILPFMLKEKICHNLPKNHFLYIGQLEQQKGVSLLLNEFKHALQKNKNLTLILAGSGSQENLLKEQVKYWNLEDKIHFIGWIENPDALYRQCSALIFPSIGMESFGLVITEAMAHARPVIGSHRGPTAWLVDHNKTGLLFDPLKPGELANAILTLADNPLLIETLGKNAHEKSKKFPENVTILNQHITLYKAVQIV
jgi:glycosyltransferase involved in cell wall biosynthesis